MGILSNTLQIISKEIEDKNIDISNKIKEKINTYISNKSTNKKEGNELLLALLNNIIKSNHSQLEIIEMSKKTSLTVNKDIEELKALLKPETKPFERDKKKYFRIYQLYFILAIITTILLIYLLVMPFYDGDWLSAKISSQILYRISIIIPLSTIVALFIYQFQNALKHYHKACEAIHIMSSYPAIINTISLNEKQKEKANSRLFEILFDWHPRPSTRN